MITMIIMWVVLGLLLQWWTKDSELSVPMALVLTLVISVVILANNTTKHDTFATESTVLRSIKNFDNTSGIWYIGTDSDYISYVDMGEGVTKFRMPENSILIEDENLLDTGIYERKVCVPGEDPSVFFLFTDMQAKDCDMNSYRGLRNNRNIIRVPKGTVTLDFKV